MWVLISWRGTGMTCQPSSGVGAAGKTRVPVGRTGALDGSNPSASSGTAGHFRSDTRGDQGKTGSRHEAVGSSSADWRMTGDI